MEQRLFLPKDRGTKYGTFLTTFLNITDKMLKQTCSTAGGPAGRASAAWRPALRCPAVGRPTRWSPTAIGPWAHGPWCGWASAWAGVLMEDNVQHVAGQRVDVAVVAVAAWTRLRKQKHWRIKTPKKSLTSQLWPTDWSTSSSSCSFITQVQCHQLCCILPLPFKTQLGPCFCCEWGNCPSYRSPGTQYHVIIIATQKGRNQTVILIVQLN